ncbi:MAG: NUDIX hydrolase [Cyanobacteria bacterium]|nr:NUDIX hydrolase [Cyanobacteriota bacterium]
MGKKPRIRPIAICLFRQGDRILVYEDTDSVRQLRFGRPLGGGLDFGETSEAAIAREIREELSAEIHSIQLLGILESVFEYEGKPGHEIVFVYDAKFVNESLYERSELDVNEGKRQFKARWRSLDDFRQDAPHLVPEGLWQFL